MNTERVAKALLPYATKGLRDTGYHDIKVIFGTKPLGDGFSYEVTAVCSCGQKMFWGTDHPADEFDKVMKILCDYETWVLRGNNTRRNTCRHRDH